MEYPSRVVLTLVVGAGLAVAGGLLQGVFGNPLAAPSIVGVSASGAAGASIGAALGIPFNSIPLAFMGVILAGVGLIVVRAIASRDGKVNSTALLSSKTGGLSPFGLTIGDLVTAVAPLAIVGSLLGSPHVVALQE